MASSENPPSAHALESSPVRLSLATWSALGASCLISGIKFWGWQVTSSQAVYSDFLESIVNIVAGVLAIFVVRYSAKPADRDHPYGHGKTEPMAGLAVSILLIFAVIEIATGAIERIRNPLTGIPASWTLIILIGVVILK